MESDNRAYNHWLLIAQAQKIGVLQLVVSDENACNGDGKPYNSPAPIPPTYSHYFHTLLIPSQELTFPWKPTVTLYPIYHSCILFMSLSTHMLRNSPLLA